MSRASVASSGLAVLALVVASLEPADAFWETKVSDWRKADIAFKVACVSGFLQGHLLHYYLGHQTEVREHFKTCLGFASLASIDDVINQTLRSEPELATGDIGRVVMRTLFRMCGPAKAG